MAQNIPESDWKILRDVKTQVLERFCEQVLAEIEQVKTDRNTSFHQKYLAIYTLIQEHDADLAFIFNDLRRSTAFQRIMAMRSHKLLTETEFSRFSQETRTSIDRLLSD
jgi:adenine-specific DNA methylase